MPPQELSQTAAKVQRSKCVKVKHRKLTRLPESCVNTCLLGTIWFILEKPHA